MSGREVTSERSLRLRAGEAVDKSNTNRGLLFDREMTLFCGGLYRVENRVEQIIEPDGADSASLAHPA